MIDDTEARVDELSLQADAFLVELLNLASVTLTTGLPTTYNYANIPGIQFPVFSATPPIITVSGDPVPEAPAPTSFSTVADVLVPDLAAVAPTLDLPSLPSSTLPTAPAGAPEFVTPDIPGVPSITLPSPPTFASLALPEPPSINLPSFAGTLPTDDLVVPSNTFSYAEAAYSSILLDPLKAKLLDDMINGSYGIETADEAALFQRMRDREAEAMLTRVSETRRSFAARGFPLPPGELAVFEDAAYQEMQAKLSSANREIHLERSRLFNETRKFTIEQVRDLEQVLINFHNAVQERALNVSKATLEASLSIYNALVQRYQARLQAYQAESTAFAERIRGELAKAEIYRTQIEASRLTVEQQRTLVEVYKAQLDGIKTSVDIYRVQMEGASVRAQIERQKLEAFRAQVDAYSAQVQAKVAEFQMYRSGVEGQQAKVGIYEAQVRAYGTQVSAAKTRADVQLGRLQSEAEQARVKLANYQAQLEGFKAGVQQLLETGKLNVDIYRANIEKGRAQTDGAQANAALFQQGILATVAQNTDISRLTIENAKARLAEAIATLNNRTEIIKYSAEKTYARVLATLGAIQTLAVQSEEV